MAHYNDTLGACSTAFFYGADVPAELLASHDQVVVEPSYIADVTALTRSRAVPVAYLSIGEVAGVHALQVDGAWIIGHNASWSSRVMDLTHPGYHGFVLEQFQALWRSGYRRFFLDTLDSYELAKASESDRARQLQKLAELLRAMAAAQPDARFILNRGFALLPAIASHVHAVAVESLFDGWNAARGEYVRVSETDRAWLLDRLREVEQRYRLPVIVIDYRPASERAEACKTAKRIAALGFVPWVCNSTLNDVGVGLPEVSSKRVWILTESTPIPAAHAKRIRWLAAQVSKLGYVPEHHTLSDLQPYASLRGQCYGVLTAFRSERVGAVYEAWLLTQIRSGIRVVMFDSLGFALDSVVARELGITPERGARRPRYSSAIQLLHAFKGAWGALGGSARSARLTHGSTAAALTATAWGGIAERSALSGTYSLRVRSADVPTFLSRAL